MAARGARPDRWEKHDDMTTPIKLSALVDALDMQADEMHPYLNRETGEVVPIEDHLVSAAEEGRTPEGLAEWEAEMLEVAQAIVETDAYVQLPNQFTIHEWKIMERFAIDGVESRDVSDMLLDALHGKGAFRHFKDRVHENGLADRWYAYRAEAFKQIAIDWCHEHKIEFVDDKPSDVTPAG